MPLLLSRASMVPIKMAMTETAAINIKFSFRAADLALDKISLAIVLYRHGTTYQPTVLTFQIYAVLNADTIHRF